MSEAHSQCPTSGLAAEGISSRKSARDRLTLQNHRHPESALFCLRPPHLCQLHSIMVGSRINTSANPLSTWQ